MIDSEPIGKRLVAKRRKKSTKTKSEFGSTKFGRGERIRTSGLYVPNVALYQTKLHPAVLFPRSMPRHGAAGAILARPRFGGIGEAELVCELVLRCMERFARLFEPVFNSFVRNVAQSLEET